MFKTVVPGGSFFDESKNIFIEVPRTPLQLEHSLLSVSRWESKWNRSFFDNGPKTDEEELDYIRCMTITTNVDPVVYKVIPRSIRRQIKAYCSAPMTATTFGKEPPARPSKKIITSEIVYYWMITYGIPFECEKWHLNRLMTLIRVCSIKNNPKKETKADAIKRTRATNAARRAKH